MKKLIVARHGQYGRDDRLNETGREQVTGLAEKLATHINGASVLLLTSPVDRARESAEIIGIHFGVALEEQEILWSGDGHTEDFPSVLELVRSRQGDADVLILMTHFEYVEQFPAYFAKEELGVKLECWLIKKGEAWIVDCEERSLIHVV